MIPLNMAVSSFVDKLMKAFTLLNELAYRRSNAFMPESAPLA